MPFTTEQFLGVFGSYNTTVFPAQIFLNLLALLAIYLLIKNSSISSTIISGILAVLWLWTGLVYHLIFFISINKAAYLFGALYVIQAAIFLHFGVLKQQFHYMLKKDWIGTIGWVLIIYSLVVYPLLGYAFGHGYPRQPTFGLPCPTTIFTFGILLFNTGIMKWYYIIIPFIWSLLGTSAAVQFGIAEDLGLLAAGVIGFTLLVYFNRPKNQTVKDNLQKV